MKSVRVVHVSSVHKLTDPRIFEKECHALADAGYDVTFIANGSPPASAPFRTDAVRRFGSRPLRMVAGTADAVWKALRRRPTLVHLHDPELIPWIPLLRLARIKVVFDSHEDIEATMLRKPYLTRPAQRVLAIAGRLLERVADGTASGVVVATPTIAQKYSRAPQCLVQNFPRIDDWTPGEQPDPGAPRLVYIGGISEVRGVWQMLSAMSVLGPRYDARLILAGPVAPTLLEEMERHEGWAHCDYLGLLSRSEVTELLERSSIGVVLFQPEPNHVNSQPTKMFEYMAAGLPVLASDYPLWRELVAEPGIGVLADPTDVDAIVAMAEGLIRAPQDARAMGLRGREVVTKTRNWDNEARTLVQFYDRLLR